MLKEFISVHRDEIIHRCRVKMAARSKLPLPTGLEIDHGVPLLLDQLVDALRLGQASSPQIDKSAGQHGHDLLQHGFTVSQVVHGYGDVCQSITELAVETSAPISADDFRMLNGCLDGAIAGAVTVYEREGVQTPIDGGNVLENEPLAVSVWKLRKMIRSATIAFEVIQSGNVGVGGSTGAVVRQSLLGAADLIDRALADVRLTQTVQERE
jgi:hypothetical protein